MGDPLQETVVGLGLEKAVNLELKPLVWSRAVPQAMLQEMLHRPPVRVDSHYVVADGFARQQGA